MAAHESIIATFLIKHAGLLAYSSLKNSISADEEKIAGLIGREALSELGRHLEDIKSRGQNGLLRLGGHVI